MFADLYEGIGGKIKKWAQWIFIVEAISSIIAGIICVCTDEDLVLYGFLAIFVGPIVAWVSSWILYAFGELVEDVHAIRYKEASSVEKAPIIQSAAPATPAPSTWVCTCGKMHHNYEMSCVCGMTKEKAKAAKSPAQSAAKPAERYLFQEKEKLPEFTARVSTWTCTCGKVHQDYESACSCGVTKQEAKAAQQKV